MRFSGEYFFARRKLAQIEEDEHDLVSQFTESELADFADESDLKGFETPKNKDLAKVEASYNANGPPRASNLLRSMPRFTAIN